jgi:hypothetical protein
MGAAYHELACRRLCSRSFFGGNRVVVAENLTHLRLIADMVDLLVMPLTLVGDEACRVRVVARLRTFLDPLNDATDPATRGRWFPPGTGALTGPGRASRWSSACTRRTGIWVRAGPGHLTRPVRLDGRVGTRTCERGAGR